MTHSLIYRGFTIDFAPFSVDGLTFGAQWTLTPSDPHTVVDIPISSGDLQVRGAPDEMAALARLQAIDWIDRNRGDSRR
ncbi:hypothetical protein AB4Y42_31100 [Paraburkholderia sp. EG286B]|uniref:hypothetical protein n=1 Tax=Paraburkholderia sp. EG286B TaxID=3237011 RepID=UPI0034D38E68